MKNEIDIYSVPDTAITFFARHIVIDAIADIFKIPRSDGHWPNDGKLEDLRKITLADLHGKFGDKTLTRLCFRECGLEPDYVCELLEAEDYIDKVKKRIAESPDGFDGYEYMLNAILESFDK